MRKNYTITIIYYTFNLIIKLHYFVRTVHSHIQVHFIISLILINNKFYTSVFY